MTHPTSLVFIPSYQQTGLLRSCIDSVLSSFETKIIILDDSIDSGISDFVADMRKAGNKEVLDYLKPMETRERTSHISSWNRYLALTRGMMSSRKDHAYINLRHHDDHLIPRLSQSIKEDFADTAEPNLVVHPIMVTALKIGRLELLRYHCTPILQSMLIKYLPLELILLFNYIGPTACIWIREDLALRAPGFDEQLRWLVDVDWYFGLLKACKRSQIKVSVNAANKSKSHSQSITNQLRPQISLIQKRERRQITQKVELSAGLFVLAALLRPLNRVMSCMWLKVHISDAA